MKNTKLIFSLLSFFSALNIDSAWAMMSAMDPLKRIAVKRRAPQMLQRRSMHTQGYKPKESIPSNIQEQTTHTQLKTQGFRPDNPIKVDEWHTLNLPAKVEWVDDSYEIFKAPKGFQEMLEKSLSKIDRE